MGVRFSLVGPLLVVDLERDVVQDGGRVVRDARGAEDLHPSLDLCVQVLHDVYGPTRNRLKNEFSFSIPAVGFEHLPEGGEIRPLVGEPLQREPAERAEALEKVDHGLPNGFLLLVLQLVDVAEARVDVHHGQAHPGSDPAELGTREEGVARDDAGLVDRHAAGHLGREPTGEVALVGLQGPQDVAHVGPGDVGVLVAEGVRDRLDGGGQLRIEIHLLDEIALVLLRDDGQALERQLALLDRELVAEGRGPQRQGRAHLERVLGLQYLVGAHVHEEEVPSSGTQCLPGEEPLALRLGGLRHLLVDLLQPVVRAGEDAVPVVGVLVLELLGGLRGLDDSEHLPLGLGDLDGRHFALRFGPNRLFFLSVNLPHYCVAGFPALDEPRRYE